jgi:hypothetical protein
MHSNIFNPWKSTPDKTWQLVNMSDQRYKIYVYEFDGFNNPHIIDTTIYLDDWFADHHNALVANEYHKCYDGEFKTIEEAITAVEKLFKLAGLKILDKNLEIFK